MAYRRYEPDSARPDWLLLLILVVTAVGGFGLAVAITKLISFVVGHSLGLN